jgi:hypothetical protein
VRAIASLGGNNAMCHPEHLNGGNKLVLEAQLAKPSRLVGAERLKYEALSTAFGRSSITDGRRS